MDKEMTPPKSYSCLGDKLPPGRLLCLSWATCEDAAAPPLPARPAEDTLALKYMAKLTNGLVLTFIIPLFG